MKLERRLTFKRDGVTWTLRAERDSAISGVTYIHRPVSPDDLRAAGWVPAVELRRIVDDAWEAIDADQVDSLGAMPLASAIRKTLASERARADALEKELRDTRNLAHSCEQRCEARGAKLDAAEKRAEEAERERDEARKERDFFDAERCKVALREEEILNERDEAVTARNIAINTMATQARQLGRLQSTLDTVREWCGNNALRNADDDDAQTRAEVALYLMSLINGNATPPADDAIEARDGCWHCGDILEPDPAPRCDRCPRNADECPDGDDCDEPGCAPPADDAKPAASEQGRRDGVRLTALDLQSFRWHHDSVGAIARNREGTDMGRLASAVRALLFVEIKAAGLDAGSDAGCRANRDGECSWDGCPQTRDGEPERTGRSCPLADDEGVA